MVGRCNRWHLLVLIAITVDPYHKVDLTHLYRQADLLNDHAEHQYSVSPVSEGQKDLMNNWLKPIAYSHSALGSAATPPPDLMNNWLKPIAYPSLRQHRL